MMNPIEIKKGDTVEIASSGLVVKGVVVTVDYWDNDGWDIELTDANVSGGYSRWKQWQDGGKVLSVNGEKIQ